MLESQEHETALSKAIMNYYVTIPRDKSNTLTDLKLEHNPSALVGLQPLLNFKA